MPVTVILEHHEPRPHPFIRPSHSIHEFLQRSCPYEYTVDTARVQASSFFRRAPAHEKIYPSTSSFVRSAIEAWARHSHLVLRPDDIWFQILVQLNFFMVKNGEDLRELFVSHKGQEEIEIVDEGWSTIIGRFEQELQERVKTPWLAEWVSPGFSTSRPDDELAAIVLMMGLMSTFFEYAADEICGIPSITLLGNKQDWERLLKKIDRLADFGKEPEDYQRRLRPILTRVVQTFDEPSSAATKDFWDQLVHAKVKHDITCGRPPLQYTISGWILGLFYWKSTGLANRNFSEGSCSATLEPGTIVFDNVHYGEEYLENLPIGYGKVALKSLKQEGQSEGERRRNWLIAGSIGKTIVDGAPEGYLQSSLHSTAQSSGVDKRQDSGRLSSIFRSLSCFCGEESRDAPKSSCSSEAISEKEHSLTSSLSGIATADITVAEGHSTMQPCSGWVLFGPQKETRTFIDDEEVCGPTVDAINSCGNVEHYGNGPLAKGWVSAVAKREIDPDWYHLPAMGFENTYQRGGRL